MTKKHPLYQVWANMLQRCHNPNNPGFSDYGGRGIYVSREWQCSSRPFIDWAIKSGYRPGLQIDRENNDGPYSPSNCRFVTPAVNSNNRRNIRRLPSGMPLSLAIKECNLSKNTVHSRLRYGWSIDDAISVPVGGKRPSVSKKGGSK